MSATPDVSPRSSGNYTVEEPKRSKPSFFSRMTDLHFKVKEVSIVDKGAAVFDRTMRDCGLTNTALLIGAVVHGLSSALMKGEKTLQALPHIGTGVGIIRGFAIFGIPDAVHQAVDNFSNIVITPWNEWKFYLMKGLLITQIIEAGARIADYGGTFGEGAVAGAALVAKSVLPAALPALGIVGTVCSGIGGVGTAIQGIAFIKMASEQVYHVCKWVEMSKLLKDKGDGKTEHERLLDVLRTCSHIPDRKLEAGKFWTEKLVGGGGVVDQDQRVQIRQLYHLFRNDESDKEMLKDVRLAHGIESAEGINESQKVIAETKIHNLVKGQYKVKLFVSFPLNTMALLTSIIGSTVLCVVSLTGGPATVVLALTVSGWVCLGGTIVSAAIGFAVDYFCNKKFEREIQKIYDMYLIDDNAKKQKQNIVMRWLEGIVKRKKHQEQPEGIEMTTFLTPEDGLEEIEDDDVGPFFPEAAQSA